MPPFDPCLDLDQNPWGGPRRDYAFSNESELGDHPELEKLGRRTTRHR